MTRRLRQAMRVATGKAKHLVGLKTPLRITHVITYRCNLTCDFCVLPQVGTELTTAEVKGAMDTFGTQGAVSWGFTGGEPFVRKDLVELMRYAKSLGFVTTVVTNGWFVDRIESLETEDVDLVMISSEGSESATERWRGQGTHDRLIRSAKALRARNIPVSFEMVLSDDNMGEVEEVLALAKEYEATCNFQPIFDMGTGKEDSTLAGDPSRLSSLHDNVRALIDLKRRGEPIGSSMSYLKYLLNYGRESFEPNYCYAGELYGFLMPDGAMQNCWWVGNERCGAGESHFDAFERLKGTKKSCHCWPKCHGEYSAFFSVRPAAILSAAQQFKRN